LLRESHEPAQAFPLLATVTTPVLLDWNDTGVVTGEPLLFLGLAVNSCVDPKFSETMSPGERPTLEGMGKFVALVALLLQPVSRLSADKELNRTITERKNLPMHPPHPAVHG
jgi:hypothetical protein